MKGIVTDIQRFSVHDGPGIRTLIFLKGCPLRCPWCCNPETQLKEREIAFYEFKCIGCNNCFKVCPQSAILQTGNLRVDRSRCNLCGACVEVCPSGALKIIGDAMTVDEVYAVIEKDRIFYEKSGGGVTFSGGEPLGQIDFLIGLLDRVKEAGIHTAVETSGYAEWTVFEKMKEKVDLFLYDLKILDEVKHRDIIRVENRVILDNLQKLVKEGVNVVVRIPVIPELTHNGYNIENILKFVSSLEKIKSIHLLPYHKLGKSKYKHSGRDYELESIEPPDGSEMEKLAEKARQFGLDCIIGG